jgi:hypothetical protein
MFGWYDDFHIIPHPHTNPTFTAAAGKYSRSICTHSVEIITSLVSLPCSTNQALAILTNIADRVDKLPMEAARLPEKKCRRMYSINIFCVFAVRWYKYELLLYL